MERYQGMEATLQQIGEEKIIAVIRERDPDSVLPVVRALLAGGIRVIEITLTTPGAHEHLRELLSSTMYATSDRKRAIVGVGSLRTVRELEELAGLGPAFAASPICDRSIIERCRAGDVVMMPGALTPNEIVAARDAGAPVVKLFPMPTDGAAYLRSILAPLPDLRIAPSGGITADNAAALLRAGAWGLNVGSWLTPAGDDLDERCAEITRRARELREVCRTVTSAE